MTDTELRGTLQRLRQGRGPPVLVGRRVRAADWGSPSPAPPPPCPSTAEEKHLHVRSTSRLIRRFDFASFPLRAAGRGRPPTGECFSTRRYLPRGGGLLPGPPTRTVSLDPTRCPPHHVQRSPCTNGSSLPLASSHPSFPPPSFSSFLPSLLFLSPIQENNIDWFLQLSIMSQKR